MMSGHDRPVTLLVEGIVGAVGISNGGSSLVDEIYHKFCALSVVQNRTFHLLPY